MCSGWLQSSTISFESLSCCLPRRRLFWPIKNYYNWVEDLDSVGWHGPYPSHGWMLFGLCLTLRLCIDGTRRSLDNDDDEATPQLYYSEYNALALTIKKLSIISFFF
jgi:hypothetical protein